MGNYIGTNAKLSNALMTLAEKAGLSQVDVAVVTEAAKRLDAPTGWNCPCCGSAHGPSVKTCPGNTQIVARIEPDLTGVHEAIERFARENLERIEAKLDEALETGKVWEPEPPFDDLIRCECGRTSKCDRPDCKSPFAGAVAYGDAAVSSGKVTTHTENLGAAIPAQDADAAFWAKVPEGYDWVAMDANGKCRSHEKEPLSFGGRWIHEAYTPYHHIPDLDDYHAREDWQNSLRRRPEGM